MPTSPGEDATGSKKTDNSDDDFYEPDEEELEEEREYGTLHTIRLKPAVCRGIELISPYKVNLFTSIHCELDYTEYIRYVFTHYLEVVDPAHKS